MTLGIGRAEAIDDADFFKLAKEIGCTPSTIEAIAQVESSGFGWFPDGRMKILFEKHWFYKLVPAGKRTAASKSGVARQRWVSPAKGGYSDQKTPDSRYALLARAIEFDNEAALQSISMGRFQIMGFNHELCGFKSAEDMWFSFLDSEWNQLQAFSKFLKRKGLYPALRVKDFAKIEKIYNGGGLGGAYARKMARAEKKLAAKWAKYKPSSAPKPTPAPTAPKTRTKPSSGFWSGLFKAILGRK